MRSFLTVLIFFAALTACNMVDLRKDVPTEPSLMTITVKWDDRQPDRPDSMSIAVDRIVRTHHETGKLKDTLRLGGLPDGEYFVTAFTRRPEKYIVSGLDEFAISNGNMGEIAIGLPEREYALAVPEGAKDFNVSVPFTVDAGHIYAATGRCTVTKGSETSLELYPMDLTGRLGLEFSIRVADNSQVNGVWVSLSGIASKVRPMSGTVGNSGLKRLSMTAAEKGRNGNRIAYSCSARVLGLFPSFSGKLSVGDGILNVTVFTDKKTYYAGVNLRETITRSGVMADKDGNGSWILKNKNVTLSVNDILVIDGDTIVSEGDGVEEWFDAEYIDVLIQ